MPQVHFASANTHVEVEPGTDILTAARKAGIAIEAECGGKGTCKSCLAEVIKGKVTSGSEGYLPQDVLDEGYILACLAKVGEEDVWVKTPGMNRGAEGQFADYESRPQEREGLEKAYDPAASLEHIQVDEPEHLDGLSDVDRLYKALREQSGLDNPPISLPVLKNLAQALRAQEGKISVGWADIGKGPCLVFLRPGHDKAGPIGASVDVGTTSVALSLYDMTSFNRLATVSDYNGQMACGLDVISRINYAARSGGLKDLQRLIRRTLDGLLARACEQAGCRAEDILILSCAGNTVMTHLLLGLDPEYIRIAPYVPTVFEPRGLFANDIGLKALQEVPLLLSPAVGSYVGGDITSGLMQTDILDDESVGMFIDIGTNGEVAVGNRDFLLSCACSAGPAFEGGGISCGMRAASGAVEKVTIDPETAQPRVTVIGGGSAKGVCGSGIISLIAELFRTGWLDAGGRLNRKRSCPRIRVQGRRAEYILCEEEGDTPELVVTEADIDAVLRAKAAIYAGCRFLLQQVDMDFSDLGSIVVAGGFGRFLNVSDGVTIGLLPDMDKDRFSFVGNASLAGATQILQDKAAIAERRELASRMTYVDLSSDTGYMDQYTAALFLPHTEKELFPSVSSPGNAS